MEPVLIIIVIFASFIAAMKMIIGYKQSKLLTSSMPDRSVGSSELEEMIERAVQKALEPLVDDIQNVKKQVDVSSRPLLTEHESSSVKDQLHEANDVASRLST